MLTPELLAKLTPEAIAGLSPADKQRVIEILKDLELTGYQRHWRDIKAQYRAWIDDCQRRGVDPWEERRAQGLPGLAEVLERTRELLDERERRKDPTYKLTAGEKLSRELYNAPDHQAFLAREAAEQERQAEERAASYRAAQERYRQSQAEQAEQESEPVSVPNLPRPVSIAEVARRAQEQAFAEANREQPDFIDRICGQGSDKPSGRSNGGRLGFMG